MGLQFDARWPGKTQVSAFGGAGEQIALQSERAEHAALHAVQDGREIVGAENGGGGGEFRGGCSGGGGRGEVAGVGDVGGDDFEDSPDAPRDGAGFCGGWGCSCHGLVVAGLGEQSKKIVIEFLMRGYVGWDSGSRHRGGGRGGFGAASLLCSAETAKDRERHDRGTDRARAGRGAGRRPVPRYAPQGICGR